MIGHKSRVAIVVAVVAAALGLSAVANASTAGSVGVHGVGWANCSAYDGTITVYTPRIYAVNARYGAANDFQHVAYTVYFYDGTSGTPIGNGGRFVSWQYPGWVAADNSSASFNDYQSQTYGFNGHGPVTMWIFEEWFDSPTTSAFSATHTIRTGWAWEPIGTCTI